MRTSTIAVAGSRIRVIEDGTGEQAVLFVHGVGGWAENWIETIERVAASGRRAIAFDLPGFGDSTAVKGARYFDPLDPFYPAVVHPEAWRSVTLVAPGGFGPDIALFLRVFS
ncbi:MAG TPA: alpha/beta fold hydrolase, partial [Candidatus Limnocylindria bacterium]